ncbi:hypothetical protein OFO07_04080 [Campylobacter sp. JMF_06 NA1]|uniref:hypothetical protein n=1 Tax=Campylobacter sp. JMF_06 NA1 TaxID=2983823 RepID=UPI0022E9FB8A|nr:hypothetical protein [Campylobacter sp. JMF_06 NA1]MDA3078103.1 hypothetical protein [Campylobacter sp. JMF_06 NA1]
MRFGDTGRSVFGLRKQKSVDYYRANLSAAKGRIMSVRAKSVLGYETSPDERGLFD